MIAKSKLTALLLGLFFCSQVSAVIDNKYERILKEFEIHPPNLKYGYPLWYQYDSLPVTGVIFLKNGLDNLEKIDNITYVAEPTAENAKIILNFSGPVEGFPKFYIVPDSTISREQFFTFLDSLTPMYSQSEILLCGKSGNWVNLRSADVGGRFIGCGLREIVVIMMNLRGQILYEGEFLAADSLSARIEDHYSSGFLGEDFRYSHFYRDSRSTEYYMTQVSYWQKMLEGLDTSEHVRREWYKQEMTYYQTLFDLTSEFGPVQLWSPTALIQVKIQGRDESISAYFELIDKINSGIFAARNQRSLDRFQINYTMLFSRENVRKLFLIHAEMPDIVVHTFGERYMAPPIQIYRD